jgi:hypothetical protein
VGRIGNRQADEVTQLDQAGLLGIFNLQIRQRGIQTQQRLVVGRGGKLNIVQIHALQTATMTDAAPPARTLDEDATHGLGGSGKKMTSTAPVLIGASEFEPGLVHQLGRLQGLVVFLREPGRRQLAQFVINE